MFVIPWGGRNEMGPGVEVKVSKKYNGFFLSRRSSDVKERKTVALQGTSTRGELTTIGFGW